jgi:probable phosphoglycerate mutase
LALTLQRPPAIMRRMTQLILIRHGETDWNRERRFQGQTDIDLNDAGRLQARRLADALAGERIDHLYSSDLKRALQTAEPTARRLGLRPVTDAGLREQHFGPFEGLLASEVPHRLPEVWAQWVRHDPHYAAPGGESLHRFFERVLGTLRRIAAAHRGQTLLIVTHGGALDMVWRAAHGHTLAGPRDCAIPNCGINRLRLEGDALHIEQWADDAHLQGLPAQPSTVPASVAFSAA